MWRSQTLLDNILTCTVFGVAYWVSFEISNYLNLTQGFAPGISLVFIPAGVKLLAALIGGFWGIVGVVMALTLQGYDIWSEQSQTFILLNALINGFSTLAVVELMRRILKIDQDLSNIRFLHLPLIDLANSICLGFIQNGHWVFWGMEEYDEFLTKASATAFGDFFGSMILLLGWAIFLKTKHKIT